MIEAKLDHKNLKKGGENYLLSKIAHTRKSTLTLKLLTPMFLQPENEH